MDQGSWTDRPRQPERGGEGSAEAVGTTTPGAEIQPRAQRWAGFGAQGPILAVVALGGGVGALSRYGLAQLVPTSSAGGFPWATFLANALGCLLIGVLMVVITEVWTRHRLVRPFLGVGLLGGFTTFSTHVVEFRELLGSGSAGLAFGYLGGTLLSAMLAVLLGVRITRAMVSARTSPTELRGCDDHERDCGSRCSSARTS